MNRGFNGIQHLFVSDLECRSKTLLSIVGMFSLSPITCGNEPSLRVAAGSWARRKRLALPFNCTPVQRASTKIIISKVVSGFDRYSPMVLGGFV